MLNKRVWPEPVIHPLSLCHPERSEGPSDLFRTYLVLNKRYEPYYRPSLQKVSPYGREDRLGTSFIDHNDCKY